MILGRLPIRREVGRGAVLEGFPARRGWTGGCAGGLLWSARRDEAEESGEREWRLPAALAGARRDSSKRERGGTSSERRRALRESVCFGNLGLV